MQPAVTISNIKQLHHITWHYITSPSKQHFYYPVQQVMLEEHINTCGSRISPPYAEISKLFFHLTVQPFCFGTDTPTWHFKTKQVTVLNIFYVCRIIFKIQAICKYKAILILNNDICQCKNKVVCGKSELLQCCQLTSCIQKGDIISPSSGNDTKVQNVLRVCNGLESGTISKLTLKMNCSLKWLINGFEVC